MGQIKHKMGSISGGVNLSPKGPKMSGKAKSLESYPGGMPGPGNYGSMENKVVGKGMGKYLAGESVGMAKYKHKGAAQMDPMHNGKPGVQKEDFEQFGAPKSTGPAKKETLGAKEARIKAEKKAAKLEKRTTKSSAGDIKAKARKLSALNKSRAKAKQRILTAKKNNVYGKGPAKVDPPVKTEELKGVTVYGKKSKVGANDKKVLDDMASGGRSAKSIKDATEKYGKKAVDVSVRSSNADKGLYNKVRAAKK